MIDYYATFGPAVPEDLDRLAVVLEAVLFQGREPAIYRNVDRLVRAGERYEYSWEGASFDSLREALAGTATWDGVEFHFGMGPHRWSILLWRDAPGLVTVNLCEPGPAFREQVEDQTAREQLARCLVGLMDGLGAKFCVFEEESTFSTRTRDDILLWLRKVPGADPIESWPLVICDDEVIPSANIFAAGRRAGHFYRRIETERHRGRWMLSRMGLIGGVIDDAGGTP